MNAPHDCYELTVSIVTYNTNQDELERAVTSCRGSGISTDILIIDNSPSEDLRPFCLSLGTRYIHTRRNIGFGAAHNIAFCNSSASKYHLVLNPDVTFGEEVLGELASFLDVNPSVGLAMPQVRYPDGSLQKLSKRLPSPLDILLKRALPGILEPLFRERLSRFQLEDMDANHVVSVPYLSGCFMFLRRSTLDKVGYFDERFFMYFEDLDLSRRLHAQSHTVYYPYATVVHRHNKGSYKSLRLLFYGIHSAIQYFNKWGWINDSDRSAVNEKIRPLPDLRIPQV